MKHSLKTLIKLGSHCNILSVNLEAIEALKYHKESSLYLYHENVISHKDYQIIKNFCSKEGNKLQSIRKDIIERNAEAFRKQYKDKCEKLKIKVNHKQNILESVLLKLSVEEREILKEYSFKL